MTYTPRTRHTAALLLTGALIATPLSTLSATANTTPTITPIAQIQGTGDATPLAGQQVTTRGVVTASYPTGGFRGFIIQTPGTGDNTDNASQALFIYAASTNLPAVGDYVEVTGTAGEYNGLTQLSQPSETPLDESVDAPLPYTGQWPRTDEERERLESMLYQPSASFTVTNTYSTNQYGELGLAFGDTPLQQPTDVARPGTDDAAGVESDNAARTVVLDDGATTNFFSTKTATPPYISVTDPVRVGAPVTFDEPVVVDYRNGTWKLNPTSAITPGDEPVTVKNTRTNAPTKETLGDADITLASFNVLNYFTTTGEDWINAGHTCSSYTDKDGQAITTRSCSDNGPRGAWDTESFTRQQNKIVAAINALDASVVGLLEIENSAALGEDADEATTTLVAALNAAAGEKRWAAVASSQQLPPAGEQDAITNAIIYQVDHVEPLGQPQALGDKSGAGEAFSNAREPIGQAFIPATDGEPFFYVVNHFKSKGSAGPLPGDDDQGDGQGSSNASRVAQATALTQWVPTALDTIVKETGTTITDVALAGDFNAYTREDPMTVLSDAGYTNAAATHAPDKASYSYQGLSGSLDHILYNDSFADRITGADIWNINAPESIALEYSRYNYHGTVFYENNAYRSSDHDPVIVGVTAGSGTTTPATIDLNILDINDFHGRIDANTVAFAGTIEEARSEHPDTTVFLSAGDNIGASLFASSVADDKPTLDVLNTLDLAASAVGNHEFDVSFDHLTTQIKEWSQFPYLGANVYTKGTTTPALDEYTVIDVDGVAVGVIGAVTEETPSLVTPGGIADIEFGDPVDAVNRVAEQLTDGDDTNGEADVIVALYHEGASAGTPDGSTLKEEIDAGGVFADIATLTSAEVDAIFTGHTHKQYAWLADNNGAERPIIQTGSYGDHIGQAVLTLDTTTKEVVAARATNIARTTTPASELIATYPRVAQVSQIVDDALAHAQEVGARQVGSITADITTAYRDGEYVDGIYTGGSRDDRSSASTLGTLVANSLRDTLQTPERGGADFGVVNPGGLRADLLYGDDGVITYAQANAVLPFVNNLWTTSLTGAQVKTLLEQQWQRTASGEVPSRPYLQLGLSDNVTYTFDASRDEGDRITSVSIDGQPLDTQRTYVVGTFSFLAQGGDNFHVLKDGTNTKDSGLIDREAWIAYLTANKDLAPDFARQSVSVSPLPTTVTTGDTLTTTVSDLNLTSLGSPANTRLTVEFLGGDLNDTVTAGEVTVTQEQRGTAQVALEVPDSAAGAGQVRFTAQPSGTTVTIPIDVTADSTPPAADYTTTTSLDTGKKHYAGAPIRMSVTVKATPATNATTNGAQGRGKGSHHGKKTPKVTGTVDIVADGETIATGPVKNGRAHLTVTLPAGSHSLTAVFTATDDTTFSGSTSPETKVTIAKNTSDVRTKVKPGKVTTDKPAQVVITVTAKKQGAAPTGDITIKDGTTTIASGKLTPGKKSSSTVTVELTDLPRGTYKKLVALYDGDTNTKGSQETIRTIIVR